MSCGLESEGFTDPYFRDDDTASNATDVDPVLGELMVDQETNDYMNENDPGPSMVSEHELSGS